MELEKFKVERGKEYIYLVMVEYKNETLLKIGYTKTIDSRMDTYELHNPGIQLLSIREGTRDLENYMHKKFEKFSYPKRKEWFYYNKEIILTFDLLEEKTFLDVNQIKDKVCNLLKPKSIEELKREYYEKYQKDLFKDEVINNIITYTFYYLNKKIGNFINNLNFSEIPSEIEINTNYKFMIPNPLTSSRFLMSLEQILGGYNSNSQEEDCFILQIKDENSKSVIEEFSEYRKEKIRRTISLLSAYRKEDRTENRFCMGEVYLKVEESCHYIDDYITVEKIINRLTGTIDKFRPSINNSVQIIEDRVFELLRKDYEDRFSLFYVSKLEETKD